MERRPSHWVSSIIRNIYIRANPFVAKCAQVMPALDQIAMLGKVPSHKFMLLVRPSDQASFTCKCRGKIECDQLLYPNTDVCCIKIRIRPQRIPSGSGSYPSHFGCSAAVGDVKLGQVVLPENASLARRRPRYAHWFTTSLDTGMCLLQRCGGVCSLGGFPVTLS